MCDEGGAEEEDVSDKDVLGTANDTVSSFPVIPF